MMKNIAVITGAGTGIGRATAQRLARAGFNLALIGRNMERLERTAESISEYNVHCTLCHGDVSDGKKINSIAEKIERNVGPIDVWINCAGATIFGETASLDVDDIQRAFSVSCLGSIYGTLAALRCMRRRGKGSIINFDVDIMMRNMPLFACETASRAALRRFTDSLRLEIEHNKDRIELTTIELPSINTPFYNWTKNTSGKRIVPFSPLYEPQVIADAVCKAIFVPSETISIGPQNLLSRIMLAIFPRWQKIWAQNNGYHQLSHDWAIGEQPDNLYHNSDAPYGTEGAFSANAYDPNSILSMFISSKMRCVLRNVFYILGIGLLLKHYHHCKKKNR